MERRSGFQRRGGVYSVKLSQEIGAKLIVSTRA
jgi:hypothetical protein